MAAVLFLATSVAALKLPSCCCVSPTQRVPFPAPPTTTRRSILLAGAASCVGGWTFAALALPACGSRAVATGTISLQPGVRAVDDASAALYVTARPAESVGGALQAGTKVVPLATARYSSPIAFPFDYCLTLDNLTAEYQSADATTYETLDLLVSARLDGDGVAATRGPDDLVGRGLLKKAASREPAQWRAAPVELQGRGLTGRLLTGGSK